MHCFPIVCLFFNLWVEYLYVSLFCYFSPSHSLSLSIPFTIVHFVCARMRYRWSNTFWKLHDVLRMPAIAWILNISIRIHRHWKSPQINLHTFAWVRAQQHNIYYMWVCVWKPPLPLLLLLLLSINFPIDCFHWFWLKNSCHFIHHDQMDSVGTVIIL